MTDIAAMRSLLREFPLVDGHNDLPWRLHALSQADAESTDLTVADIGAGTLGTATQTHTDLPRLLDGGMGAQFWSVFVPADLSGDDAVSMTLEQIDRVRALVEMFPDRLELADTAEDVRRIHKAGRIASLMGAEGGHSINNSLATLRILRELGVRYMTLTHNSNVDWADSATDEENIGGLSRFGTEVVAEMNRIGMLVDLSHVSAGTMRDALAATRAPVVFTHSGARAVTDHPRNVPDDVLARLASNGGVCMATFVPSFVNQGAADHRLEREAAAREAGLEPTSDGWYPFLDRYLEENPPPVATIDDVVAHVEHLREVAGIDHIGLGGDYDGTPTLPEGLEDVTGYPHLLAALADRGWSRDDLEKLAGANILRVLEAADTVADVLSDEPGRRWRISQLDG
ncbi:dipeptidase [Kytococcus sedentarius]|uniref:dipeptidase n=1 Tax=Kytococcus sedentarius TaxID=1276 RepID=UPI0035BBF970